MKLSHVVLLAGVSVILTGCSEDIPKVCQQVIDKSLKLAEEKQMKVPSREELIKNLKETTGGDKKKMEEDCNMALKILGS